MAADYAQRGYDAYVWPSLNPDLAASHWAKAALYMRQFAAYADLIGLPYETANEWRSAITEIIATLEALPDEPPVDSIPITGAVSYGDAAAATTPVVPIDPGESRDFPLGTPDVGAAFVIHDFVENPEPGPKMGRQAVHVESVGRDAYSAHSAQFPAQRSQEAGSRGGV